MRTIPEAAASTSTTPLACRGVVKHYGPVVGIDDVDLTVAAGSVKGFLGPNGAGKTTLLRVATGLLHPDRGTVHLFGVPAAVPASRHRIGFLPADPTFFGTLTGRENLDLLAALHGSGSARRDWALDLLALRDDELDRAVSTYSSGMRQKLGIAQAVQHDPDLVLLDEPANRLDPLAHRRFEQLVRALADEGTAVLLSSHTLSEVEQVCDSVAMIHRGRILLDAPAAELLAHAPRRVTVRYRHPPASLPDGLVDPVLGADTLTARVPSRGVDTLRDLLADPLVEDLLVEPAGLEEVFYDLYATEDPGPGPATAGPGTE